VIDGSVLEARDLVKTFGRRTVVKDVGLNIRTGEIVGLLGRNGAGKTTTFLMIAGLLRPDGGRLSLDGEDISKWTTVERAGKGITYLPQEGSIFLKESVLGNLLMVLELQGLARSERAAAANALLEELGLQDLASQEAYTLSGGERRRLEICRALVLKPRFLILDEPFTGIDPLTILELQKIFLRLKNRNIGIVVSDHNVYDTFKIVDRACIIDEGEILMEGPPERLAADVRVREKFLGSSFRFRGDAEISFGQRGEDAEVSRPKRSARPEPLVHDATDETPPAAAAEMEAESTIPEKSGDESDSDV
jgi:lipopolysaccharide export system ATP-binding protein